MAKCSCRFLPIILSDKKRNDVQKLEAVKQVCEGKTKDNYTCYLIPIDDVVMEEDVMPEKQTGGIKGFFRRLWNLKNRK